MNESEYSFGLYKLTYPEGVDIDLTLGRYVFVQEVDSRAEADQIVYDYIKNSGRDMVVQMRRKCLGIPFAEFLDQNRIINLLIGENPCGLEYA